ncbi:MAG TPA: NAD(P)/FAD-dependent oxidoreductase, partial [Candidatus Nitrosotalea sp.]|nr:NAD(P)/FAD-dependent oxidoreductase [Candidatus Nitrosotalea sp.]
ILTRRGRVTGVALANGDELRAKRVASGVDCHLTFERFMDASELPEAFREAVGRISYSSASCKINVALERLPSFSALPGHEPGPQHFGTVHLCPDQDFIERAYDDAKYGAFSREPVVECTMPSSLDSTVAPPGKHLMSMFTQYAPYELKEGPWTDALRNEYADRCFDIVERYAPGFKASVIDRQILTPLDLEEKFGLTGGSIFQGAMPLHQLFAFRPVPGYAGYAMPIRGLFLCGAAAHPGGGVMGAAGWNAARVMLRG